jgi:2-haloacid dehalogenase
MTHSNNPATELKAHWNLTKPSVLVFDVNETLIDFGSMTPLFERIFGDKRHLREWLGHLVMYSMTLTLSGLYNEYYALGMGLLKMVGDIHGKTVTEEDMKQLKTGMMTMPAHPDVVEGLKQLKAAGYRLVSLTNSPPNPNGKTPLENAGLGDLIEKQYSIHSALAYKPAARVYHMVAQDLGVAPSACCMVAAHMWDTFGAQSTGFSAALITRKGNALLKLEGCPVPNYVAPDLVGLAALLKG